MGMALALAGSFGMQTYSDIRSAERFYMSCSFSGNYQKKQNKLSQKAKRKRAKQRGYKK
mgnify:CR=1 FL=1